MEAIGKPFSPQNSQFADKGKSGGTIINVSIKRMVKITLPIRKGLFQKFVLNRQSLSLTSYLLGESVITCLHCEKQLVAEIFNDCLSPVREFFFPPSYLECKLVSFWFYY